MRFYRATSYLTLGLTQLKNRLEIASMDLAKNIIFVIGVLIFFRVNAQVLEFSASEYPSLIIKGQNLDIKLSEVTGSPIRIQGITNRNQWSFKNWNGKALIVEEIVRENKRDLLSNLDIPKVKLVIQVPSIPVEISGYKTDLLVENLKKDIKVVSTSGNLRFIKPTGEMILSLINGEVVVDGHNGKLKLDGDNLKVNVKNSTSDGEYRVQNLKLELEKNLGHQQMVSYFGNLNLKQNSGSYQIELTKGSLSAIANQGRLEALLDEASAEVRLVKDNEINIKTKTGKVFVNTNNVPGVWFNLKSDDGEIYLPSPLKTQKHNSESLFKGRTAGEKTLTRGEIKTVNAPIIIK